MQFHKEMVNGYRTQLPYNSIVLLETNKESKTQSKTKENTKK